eukprot:scaffold2237_cov99-Skeletonema_dohrnii-CCMP3373.AAC.2
MQPDWMSVTMVVVVVCTLVQSGDAIRLDVYYNGNGGGACSSSEQRWYIMNEKRWKARLLYRSHEI